LFHTQDSPCDGRIINNYLTIDSEKLLHKCEHAWPITNSLIGDSHLETEVLVSQ